MARWIEEAITRHTGVTDAADVASIMDVMADHCRTFSGLSPQRFKKLAKQAWEQVAYLKTPHGQECWQAMCIAYGIELCPAF